MAGTHIRFDWAIKKLLQDKANYVVLEGFISELLGEDIKIDSILESESNRLTQENKLNRVDILAQNTKGGLLLIEVQNSSENDYFHRMLYGVSALITEYLGKGEAYSKVKKVYSINIVYFSLGQGRDYIYKGKVDFCGIHLNDKLEPSELQKEIFKVEEVYEIFPEYYVLRVNNFNDVAKDSLDEWIYFLKNSEIKDEFQARGLAQAKDNLRIENLSKAEKAAYQKYLEDKRYEISIIESAEITGELRGRKEAKLEIARVMKARGIEINLIVETTGLSIEEIEKP
ncbi:MAG: Rpn family recombination-promoting nuclease/putative transposase [Nostocales cyanobacterium 94392]|nr:Rpn family recombination-promoting nuclease/putative transposase [Nostocales cyanobacterium 94392]